MKNREFLVANLIIILLVCFASFLTFSVFSNEHPAVLIRNMFYKRISESQLPQQQGKPNDATIKETLDTRCSKKDMLPIVPGSDPHLKKLEEYQNFCGSFVTDTLMFFSALPASRLTAAEEAVPLAFKLKAFHQNGIHPIVIVEPYADGDLVNYKGFLAGGYNVALDNYFKALSDNGVTKDMMGTWIPFPESNTPNWNNKDTEPKEFALAVNKYLGFLRKYYPDVRGSILLNSTTYDPNDLEWNNGDYLSLSPYLEDINTNLVGSFGIQGFPWVSNAQTEKKRQIFRATEFLQPDMAIISAQEIRTKDIWINTGTFLSKYTNDEEKRVEVSLNDRKAMLNSILDTAKGLEEYQLNGYRVSINLFAEDKSDFTEATDWSYFQNEDSKILLREFLRKAEEYDIHISLFDIEHNK